MVIITNRIYVANGWEERFEERFRNRAGKVEQQPGCIRMQVLRPESPDSPYVVETTWEDQAAFQQWVASDDFKVAHQTPMPKEALSREGKLEAFEVIIHAGRE